MSSDLVVYNQSIEEKPMSSAMLDKKWLTQIDQNNGSYQSGQCTLETTSLSTSDRFMNYREAYLTVPLLLTVGNSTNAFEAPLANQTDTSKLVGLKNSYTTLIHSMSVDLNGTSIIQSTPFSELFNAFQLMTSLSWQDVQIQGSTIGFYPDDALAAHSYTADNLSGVAAMTVNNQDLCVQSSETNGVLGHIGNIGHKKRLEYINYDSAGKINGSTDEDDQSAFLSFTNANTLYKNQVVANSLTPANNQTPIIQTQVMAVIKLRHIHNFFNNVPLSKGLQFRFIINFNQSTTLLSQGGGTGGITSSESVEKSQFGGVNPIMISSSKTNNGGTVRTGKDGTIRADLSVGRTCLDSTLVSFGAVTSGLSANVTLHVPSYIMDPSLASSYISSNSSKRISYSDIYHFRIPNVAAGSDFNQLVTSGIRGIRSVLTMPMFPKDSNGGADGVAEHQSVQSCCGGGSTALLSQLSNYQVQIGGSNQLQSNQRYEYEMFNNYVYGANSVNAGLTDGLCSGLIGQSDWARKYLYYYLDCERGSDTERDVPKSVQIQGKNMSAKAVDYYVFIEFENSFSIDVGTGSIVA